MVATSRRVSYILPSPDTPPPYLSLPPLEQPRRGHPNPFFLSKSGVPISNGRGPAINTTEFRSRNPFLSPAEQAQEDSISLDDAAPITNGEGQAAHHPRHCLGITSLALDTSTLLANTQSPGGILYSAGRDGLVCSWELNIPHKRRRGGRYEILPGRGNRVKWEKVGDGAEFFEEDEEDEESGDEDGSGGAGRDSSDEEDEAGGGRPRGEVPYEDRWEVDHEVLSQSRPAETKFRQSAQTHTDWVNALLLCNLNQTVISASSDRTIRAWSPHASSDAEGLSPVLVGTHRDYVRSLAWAKHPSLLFSGSLDRRLSIWDVQSPHPDSPIFSINMDHIDDYGGVGMEGERGSVYALGTDPAGQILAAGTPERVIRLWDPRVGDRSIGKLIGHSDCVRSLVLSDDGRYLLSGSSDTTIKLWSLAAHRAVHTFNHHTSSVWALFSNHPNLERFYSGSRDGQICAVDVEQVTDMADGECVVLGRESSHHGKQHQPGQNGHVESKAGDEGIRAIVAMDDEYVWTATGSANVNRWHDTGRRIHRMQQSDYDGASYGNTNGYSAGHGALAQPFNTAPEGIRNKRLSLDNEDPLVRTESRESRTVAFATPPKITANDSPTRDGASPGGLGLSTRLGVPGPRRTTMSGEPIAGSIAASMLSDTSGHEEGVNGHMTVPALHGLPYESLVSLGVQDSPYSFAFPSRDDPTRRSGASLVNQNFLSPTDIASSPRKNSSGLPMDGPAYQLEVARRKFYSRDIASEATPLRRRPDGVISGRPGLVRSLMLNDRQHVLTVDTEGEVAAWNIIRGTAVGRFSAAEIAAALDLERGIEAGAAIRQHSNEVLELVKQRVEGETMVITWCQVDTKIGSLVVHLEEGRVFDAEVYVDDLGVEVESAHADARINLGKWALANLFKGLLEAEEREHASNNPTSSPATALSPSITRSPAPTHISITNSNTTPRRQRALSSISQTSSLSILGIATPAATPAILPDLEPPLSRSPPSATGPSGSPFQSFRSGPLSAIPQSPGPNSLGGPPSATASASSPAPQDASRDYFSVRRRVESSPNRAGGEGKEQPPTPGAAGGALGLGGVEKGPPGSTPAPQTPGGRMSKWKGFGKKKEKETVMSPVVENEPLPEDTGPKLSEREQEQITILNTVRSLPFRPPPPWEAPPQKYPPSTALLISEESKDAGAWVVTYRSQVSATDKDLDAIEGNSPLWLLEYLFTSRVKAKDPVKLTFILEPVPGCGLKEMPEGTTRLSASRILRARKVMAFIFEKLELGTARGRSGSIISLNSRIVPNPRKTSTAGIPINPIPHRGSVSSPTAGGLGLDGTGFGGAGAGGMDGVPQPEDVIELLHNDQVVDPRITLATLKQYYGSGGDMVLHYRPKKGVAVQ